MKTEINNKVNRNKKMNQIILINKKMEILMKSGMEVNHSEIKIQINH